MSNQSKAGSAFASTSAALPQRAQIRLFGDFSRSFVFRSVVHLLLLPSERGFE